MSLKMNHNSWSTVPPLNFLILHFLKFSMKSKLCLCCCFCQCGKLEEMFLAVAVCVMLAAL